MLISSFKTTREVFLDPWGLPSALRWENYVEAWNSANIGEGVLNSMLLVGVSGVATIILAAPAAYALSRFGNRGSSTLTVIFVLGLGVPAQAIFIPLYIAFDRLGLINSLTSLQLIYTGTGLPFAVFLLTAFFRTLPRDIEEAAVIDGASTWYTYSRIMLPLARSGIITVFMLQAIGHWGETFFALMVLQDKHTISLALLEFMKAMQYTGARWSVLFAGLSLVVLPLIVLYVWLGSRIVEGIAAGYGK
ncbi:carbohydrate ABC transporter permease [Phytoactinopolyspora endophytica]|uniref:carbohydrate ABC transporter permease n=1 Tax=Phytoactinopolyspora endophytica TaxID=1642495 RepID=UPI00197BFB71|nr:carbohydrate ABC transporter permease [Phytoactinopolyspora endophytica]